MSTRCNVLLRSPQGTAVYFYRHCDGYLTEAGHALYFTWLAMLARSKIKPEGFPWIGDFAERLLLARDKSGSPIWELTAGPHTDIDVFYCIEFPGFTDDATRDLDYAAAKALMRIRWASGYGVDLPARAMEAPPLSIDEFLRAIHEKLDADNATDAPE